MTKAELIGSVVDSVEGLTRRQATAAFEAVFAAITQALKAGESAEVPGFGSFTFSDRTLRKGRDLQASESVTLKASRGERFKPGKKLRESHTVGRKAAKKLPEGRNVRLKAGKELRETPRKRLRGAAQPKRRKHVATAASAEEISRSVGVKPREAQRVDRILGELGYLQRGLRRSRIPSNLG